MTRRRSAVRTACAAVAAGAVVVAPAWANHRTGHFALPESIAVADVNGDDILDLAVLVTGWDTVATFLGDGHGGFTLLGHVAVDTLPKGLAAGDINKDGIPDLVVCNSWGYDQTVLFGDGLGGFIRVGELDGHEEPTRVVLKDFDADGFLDVATAGKRDVRILRGDGTGRFEVPPGRLKLRLPHGMVVDDFNDDGHVDIAVTQGTPVPDKSQVSILAGDGSGGFALRAVASTRDRPNSVAAGDLNEDGFPDLLVAGAQPRNALGNFVSTYLNDGTADFALKTTVLLGRGNLKGEIAVGDFNEDRHLDVAVPQTGTDGHQGSSVLLFDGDGTGLLATGVPLAVGKEPHSAVAADFNKDGHLDLAVSNRTDGTISILLGDGSGSFAALGPFSVVPSN